MEFKKEKGGKSWDWFDVFEQLLLECPFESQYHPMPMFMKFEILLNNSMIKLIAKQNEEWKYAAGGFLQTAHWEIFLRRSHSSI